MYVCGAVAFQLFTCILFLETCGVRCEFLFLFFTHKSLTSKTRGVRALFALVLVHRSYLFYADDALAIISRDDFHLTSLVSRGWIMICYSSFLIVLHPSDSSLF